MKWAFCQGLSKELWTRSKVKGINLKNQKQSLRQESLSSKKSSLSTRHSWTSAAFSVATSEKQRPSPGSSRRRQKSTAMKAFLKISAVFSLSSSKIATGLTVASTLQTASFPLAACSHKETHQTRNQCLDSRHIWTRTSWWSSWTTSESKSQKRHLCLVLIHNLSQQVLDCHQQALQTCASVLLRQTIKVRWSTKSSR